MMSLEPFCAGVGFLLGLLVVGRILAGFAGSATRTERDGRGRAAEGLLGREAADQIFEPPEFKVHRGRCLVCGSGMEARVVLCRSCRTPHHEECWRHVRRCSMYGCEGARFAKVDSTPILEGDGPATERMDAAGLSEGSRGLRGRQAG